MEAAGVREALDVEHADGTAVPDIHTSVGDAVPQTCRETREDDAGRYATGGFIDRPAAGTLVSAPCGASAREPSAAKGRGR